MYASNVSDPAVRNSPAILEVTTVSGPALIQDGGREGFMHQGVPPGGAMVPELLAIANRAVGNPWNAPAIEVYGDLTLTVTQGIALVAIDGQVQQVPEGQHLVVPRPQHTRLRYLAIYGGFEVPAVLGGRGTLLVARLGGMNGRPLRRGDRLRALSYPAHMAIPPSTTVALSPTLDLHAPVRVIPGPDLHSFHPDALRTLLTETFTVSPTSDRVGLRLEGPRLARSTMDDGSSMPMVRGAIEVPASGEAIVLGPDHPTTGGYPVIAVVIRADLGRLLARRPGATVRFTAVDLSTARAAWKRFRAEFLHPEPSPPSAR